MKDINDTRDIAPADDDSSVFFTDSGSGNPHPDFGNIFSSRFSNITPLYTSQTGPTCLYTATRYGKRYVLKGLREQYRHDPVYSLALAKEFEIGINLDHPNIRRTIAYETVDGPGEVIVLEYFDACTLQTRLQTGRLPEDTAIDIARQISDALSYLHSKQVFHRDLKPSNILVSHHGNTVKLIDFNLSDSDSYVVLKNPAGTRQYVAPEILWTPGRFSHSADIYSLGVVLTEMAPESVRLRDIAAKCTDINPDKRPSATDIIKSLDAGATPLQTLSRAMSSKILTYILGTACTLLVAVASYMLFTRYF